MTTKLNQKQILFLISVGLVLATVIAYEPIRHNDFVRYDDHVYVTENPNVNGGITLQSVIWAFTRPNKADWHPLTWLSHMLDCEIYGLNPLGHHITNVLIHIANTLLLFLLLRQMTGAIWKSAFVAAAFALHPIHVESVAWVAERKDVLSGLFWMLTILAYADYVKKLNGRSYILVMLAFAMGLMSKPMVITLPFVLLLLDYWPLERIGGQKTEDRGQQKMIWGRLVIEKIPLFVMSGIASVTTFVVQKQAGAMNTMNIWPFPIRLTNAVGSYFNYILKMLYPKGLAVLYPMSNKPTIENAILAVIVIAVLLGIGLRGRRWLVVGLLLYLGTLVPVLGLVRVGWQSMADRYTYLPSIGIFIIIAWGAEEIFSKTHIPVAVFATGAAAALTAMVILSRIQAGYWKDSPTLYQRAIAVTDNNFIMHDNYGEYLLTQGRYEEATLHFKKALSLSPDNRVCGGYLGAALLRQEKYDEAISYLTKLLNENQHWPEMDKMYNNLGAAYLDKGNFTMAEINFRKALSINPEYEMARKNLAMALEAQSKTQKTP